MRICIHSSSDIQSSATGGLEINCSVSLFWLSEKVDLLSIQAVLRHRKCSCCLGDCELHSAGTGRWTLRSYPQHIVSRDLLMFMQIKEDAEKDLEHGIWHPEGLKWSEKKTNRNPQSMSCLGLRRQKRRFHNLLALIYVATSLDIRICLRAVGRSDPLTVWKINQYAVWSCNSLLGWSIWRCFTANHQSPVSRLIKLNQASQLRATTLERRRWCLHIAADTLKSRSLREASPCVCFSPGFNSYSAAYCLLLHR